MDMRAIVAESGTDLAWQEVPDVAAADGEVVIDVVTAGVNRADLLQAAGNYPPPPGASEIHRPRGVRAHRRARRRRHVVVRRASRSALCWPAAATPSASRCPPVRSCRIPDGVGLHEAAALPEVACTVWSNLGHDGAPGGRADVLLFHGGASGIGTHGIQVAQALGCRVAVTAGSAEKLAMCSRPRRRRHDQLPRRGLRRADQGGDRRRGRRRHPRPHGGVVPRPQRRRAGARRPPRRHRLPGRRSRPSSTSAS